MSYKSFTKTAGCSCRKCKLTSSSGYYRKLKIPRMMALYKSNICVEFYPLSLQRKIRMPHARDRLA
jgi:hypothetical protein